MKEASSTTLYILACVLAGLEGFSTQDEYLIQIPLYKAICEYGWIALENKKEKMGLTRSHHVTSATE